MADGYRAVNKSMPLRAGTRYETDIVAWANEQAALLRAGKFSQLDIEHIADEVEDLGKSEQRELASRLAVLLSHLLKWQFQPERRSKSRQGTLREQRRAIALHLEDVPSLKAKLRDQRWRAMIWADAKARAYQETDLGDFPDECPWAVQAILDQAFLPD